MQVATPIDRHNHPTDSEGYHPKGDDTSACTTKTTKSGRNRRRSSGTTIVLADRRQR